METISLLILIAAASVAIGTALYLCQTPNIKQYGWVGFSIGFIFLCSAVIKLNYQNYNFKPSSADRTVTIRAYNAYSGIVRPVYVDSLLNVYKRGDTVWVDQDTNHITQNTMSTKVVTELLVPYVIDEGSWGKPAESYEEKVKRRLELWD